MNRPCIPHLEAMMQRLSERSEGQCLQCLTSAYWTRPQAMMSHNMTENQLIIARIQTWFNMNSLWTLHVEAVSISRGTFFKCWCKPPWTCQMMCISNAASAFERHTVHGFYWILLAPFMTITFWLGICYRTPRPSIFILPWCLGKSGMPVRSELVPFSHHFNNFKARLTFIALASQIVDKPDVFKDV